MTGEVTLDARDAGGPNPPSDTPQEATAPARPIHAFFGGVQGGITAEAGPSKPKPTARTTKKKANGDSDQGRITPSASGFSIGRATVPENDRRDVQEGIRGEEERPVDEAKTVENQRTRNVSNGKGKRRAVGDDEEAEMRDMSKRTRNVSRKQRKKIGGEAPVEDSSFIGTGPEEPPDRPIPSSVPDDSSAPPPSQKSTSKSPRKRSKPRNVDNTSSTAPLPDQDIIVVSSDPPDPSDPRWMPKPMPLRAFTSAKGGKGLSRTLSNLSTNTTSSKGAQNDPIDVDETPGSSNGKKSTGPRKIVFAADHNKPAHEFFNWSRAVESARSVDIDAVRGSSDLAGPGISNGQRSDGGTAANGGPKVHSFFATSTANQRAAGKLKDGWGSVRQGEEWIAPLPRSVFPTHINSTSQGGPGQTSPAESSSCAIRRARLAATPLSDGEVKAFWRGLYTSTDTSRVSSEGAPKHRNLDSSQTDSQTVRHHAITSSRQRRSEDDREPWTELYAPQRPDQVLGNETESSYLLEWLQALSINTTFKPGDSSSQLPKKVYRKVKRSKALDGWIVDDIGMFGDTSDDLDDEYEEFIEPPLLPGQRPDSYPALGDRLAGCILLAGSHGTGKTAAVYAVAKHLGWEVFEVYPGMGKRTGAGLMSWVGDVGKNHLVSKTKAAQEPTANGTKAMGSFFGDAPEQTDAKPVNAGKGHKRGPSGDYRQSLILIEEADILFQEENTFWPTVISLIAESRRPVILTCNEVHRIPIEQLPFQAILYFHPAPSNLAVPYIQGIASQHGITDPGYASRVYVQSTSIPGHDLDRPLPPNGHEPMKGFDLRHAITQMQLDRMAEVPGPPEANELSFEEEQRSLDLRSWSDAFVSPRPAHLLELHEIDRHTTSSDDELGVANLVKPMLADHVPCLVGFDKSSELADCLCPDLVPEVNKGNLSTDRAQFIRSLLPFLDPLIPLSLPLLPRSPLFLEFLPIIQSMVLADDAMETEEDQAVEHGEARIDKKTGRPRRSVRGEGYKRWLKDLDGEPLDGAALEAVRRSIWAS